MNLNKNIFVIKTGIWAATLLSVFLYGCEQSEMGHLTSGVGDNNVAGKFATLNISLQGIPEYNAPDGGTRTANSSEPLIAEWVKVNSFDATRPIDTSGEAVSDDESGGPKIALMELREDTISSTPRTRSVMPAGVYFRLIAFRKTDDGYVFQSVADYTSNGSSSPVLQQGRMNLPINSDYRFVAYSFNNDASLGPLPQDYIWSSTSIPIPNLNNDFLTYDSGDQSPSGESLTLAIRFTHQLCKLTVKISATGFVNNTFTNCTDAYIKQGGNFSSWKVGLSGITPNTNNSALFNINDNSTAAVRLVPFTSSSVVIIHFGTLTVGDKAANNLDITSSQNVQLTRGRSYTLTAKFIKVPGIQVPESEINLGGTGCSNQDKADLSLLRWAEGNLINDENDPNVPYTWTAPTDYGYYYSFMSTYTGGTKRDGIDPCTKLDPNRYGTGWRTPTKNELEKLKKCTDKVLVDTNGRKGMWFMNKSSGLFLPAAGYRTNAQGSGTTASYDAGTFGYYWSSDAESDQNAYNLRIFNKFTQDHSYSKTGGFSVRCVKGNKQ